MEHFQSKNYDKIEEYVKDFYIRTDKKDEILDELNEHPMHLACSYGSLDVVRFTLGKCRDGGHQCGAFTLDAIDNGDSSVVKFLLEQGFDDGFNATCGIEYAVRKSRFQIADILITQSLNDSPLPGRAGSILSSLQMAGSQHPETRQYVETKMAELKIELETFTIRNPPTFKT